MKMDSRHKYVNSLLFMYFLFVSVPGWAYEKEKKIEKTYKVSDDTRIKVNNKFGLVEVNTWEKMEVWVEVTIRVDANNERTAEDILNNIQVDIEDSNPTTYLSFETEFRSRWRENIDLDIDYVINAPAKNALEIVNRHGEIYLGNRTGDVRIDLKHGRFRADELMGETDLDVAFGSGSLTKVVNGTINIEHYNRFIFDEVGDVDLDVAHSNVRVGKAGKIYVEQRHGDIEFGSIVELDGDFAHSELDIIKLGRTLLLKIAHSDVDIREVDKDFSRLDIEGSHSDVNLGISSSAGFYLDARFNFGDLKFNRSVFDVPYIKKEQHESIFKGNVNGKDARSKMYVMMQHSDVRLIEL